MHCTPRVLSLISLVFGLGSLGALALAVATDFWLWTNEAMIMEQLPPEVSNVTGDNKFWIRAHSGLWRLCLIYEFGLYSFVIHWIAILQSWLYDIRLYLVLAVIT